jgi:hypothetical protein
MSDQRTVATAHCWCDHLYLASSACCAGRSDMLTHIRARFRRRPRHDSYHDRRMTASDGQKEESLDRANVGKDLGAKFGYRHP